MKNLLWPQLDKDDQTLNRIIKTDCILRNYKNAIN